MSSSENYNSVRRPSKTQQLSMRQRSSQSSDSVRRPVSQNFDYVGVNETQSVRQSKKPSSFTRKIKNFIFHFLPKKQKQDAIIKAVAKNINKETKKLNDKHFGNTGKSIHITDDNEKTPYSHIARRSVTDMLPNYVKNSLRETLSKRASRRKGGKRKRRTRKLKNRT